MPETCINLVFEDRLSETVLRKLLSCSVVPYRVGRVHNAGGCAWIERRIRDLNHAAKGTPYFVLTDLDTWECAPVLIGQWLGPCRHPNLLFRVAVREVEAWVLGCRESFAAFLGVPVTRIPIHVDEIPNPKEFIVNLARRSKRQDVRRDLVPERGSVAKVGRGYNERLMDYVERHWEPAVARERSPSLRKAMKALDVFEPVLTSPHNSGDC